MPLLANRRRKNLYLIDTVGNYIMGFTKPIERLSRCRGNFVTEDTIPLSERNKEYLLTLQKLLYEEKWVKNLTVWVA